jgi:hypothetical protein
MHLQTPGGKYTVIDTCGPQARVQVGETMDFQPELFTGDCDRPLPVDRIVDEYEIGEILGLRVTVGDVDIPVLVNPFGGTDKTVNRYVDRGLYRRSDGSVHSYVSALGGVSIEYLADDQVDRAQQPLVEAVTIESPVETLATSTIKVGDQDIRFQLDANVARALLDGQPTLIRADDSYGVRRFEVRPAQGSNGDGGLTLAIRDLADFLANGTVDLGGRRSPHIRLDPDQVPRDRLDGADACDRRWRGGGADDSGRRRSHRAVGADVDTGAGYRRSIAAARCGVLFAARRRVRSADARLLGTSGVRADQAELGAPRL